MRRWTRLTLALAVAGCASLALTANANAAATDQPAKPATTTPAAAAPKTGSAPVAKPAVALRAMGNVSAIDANAKTLTVKTSKGDMTFSFDDKTSFRKGGKKATAADVAAGEKIYVRYKKDGDKLTATYVSVAAK